MEEFLEKSGIWKILHLDHEKTIRPIHCTMGKMEDRSKIS